MGGPVANERCSHHLSLLPAKIIQETEISNSSPTDTHLKHFFTFTVAITITFTFLAMKSSRKISFFSSSSTTTTVTYNFHNDQTTSQPQPNSTHIPIQSSSNESPVPIESNAASKIQSAYRAHIIRTLYKKISTVNSEANNLQSLIQRQETVDCIRSDEREKVRMNEALMGLLLRLDSVPGIDPTVREARRKVSRRIVGLQEILDAIIETKVDYDYYDNVWGPHGILRNWDEVVGEMEEEVCREKGGEEMERFCAQHLGFRCLQRFLRE